MVTSPIGAVDNYLIPFTAENVDELFSKTIKKDTPQIYRRNNRTVIKPCNFIVRDDVSGTSITVEWSDINRTLELFKTKSFSYLFNGLYIPEPVKAEMRARAEGITGEKIRSTPKIPDNSSSTEEASSTTTDYSNDKYKHIG
jgi:hypothetical protein